MSAQLAIPEFVSTGSYTLLSHPFWPAIKPWVKLQEVNTERGPGPRYRFEIDSKAPPEVVAIAKVLRVSCAACGCDISPIRTRGKPRRGEHVAQHMYIAVTCPITVNMGCSRGGAAKDAYLALRENLRAT